MSNKPSPWNPEGKRIIDTLEEISDHVGGNRVDPREVDAAYRRKGMEEQAAVAMASSPTYVEPNIHDNKAELLRFMSTVTPLHEEEGIIKGDIPLEIYLRYIGILHPTAHFSNMDANQVAAAEARIDRLAMRDRAVMPRKEYTSEYSLQVMNAKEMGKRNLYKNENATGLYTAVSQLIGEFKSLDMGQRTSHKGRLKQMADKLKRRE